MLVLALDQEGLVGSCYDIGPHDLEWAYHRYLWRWCCFLLCCLLGICIDQFDVSVMPELSE